MIGRRLPGFLLAGDFIQLWNFRPASTVKPHNNRVKTPHQPGTLG